MQLGSFTITAPALGATTGSDIEAFGSIIWLWMHTPQHRDMPLHALNQVLLPPLKAQQYILASALNNGVLRPVAYMCWANFSADSERRYLADANAIPTSDWSSGDRMWATDWLTPFGHSAKFSKAVLSLLPGACFRGLYHRGDERGLRVKTFRGDNVSRLEANAWWQARPMLALPVSHSV